MSLLLGLLMLLQLAFAAPLDPGHAPAPISEMTLAPEHAPPPRVDPPSGGWWTEDGPYVRVRADVEDRGTARELARHANTSAPALARRLGVALGPLVEVYLAPTQRAFDRMQPGQPPDWADGTAWPGYGMIFLRAPHLRGPAPTALTTVLDHELVHIVLGRAFGGRPVPRWLQEGVAEVYSGEVGPDRARQVLGALSVAELMPLDQLSRGFPADAAGARLAYAQSVDLVTFLARSYGPDVVPRLAKAAAAGAGFSEALLSATGDDPREVESRWRARWDSPWNRILLLADMNLVMAVAGGLSIVGLWRVRKRTQARLQRWEAEERRRMFELHPWVN